MPDNHRGPHWRPPTDSLTVIGGGSGSFSILSGLRSAGAWCESIVTMMDSGGDSGILRDAFGVLPPGDVRRCLVALSDRPVLLRQLFNFRFDEAPLAGRAFGNLFYIALTRILESERDAVLAMEQLLEVHGRVIPVTFDHAHLVARLTDGSVIVGEANIDTRGAAKPKPEPAGLDSDVLAESSDRLPALEAIEDLSLDGPAKANPDAITSIQRAQAIILAPGDIFTSLIPNLLVEGISEAIVQASAPLIQVINLMTKRGETDDWTASRHVIEVARRSGRLPDAVLLHERPIPDHLIDRYRDEGARPVEQDAEALAAMGIGIIERGPIMSTKSVLRHDPYASARCLLNLIQRLRDRVRNKLDPQNPAEKP